MLSAILIMLTVAVVLCGLVALLPVALGMPRRPDAAPARPEIGVRLTARFGRMPEAVPTSRRLARRESDTVWRLMNGELERPDYQAAMAAVAAADSVEHPLSVPKVDR